MLWFLSQSHVEASNCKVVPCSLEMLVWDAFTELVKITTQASKALAARSGKHQKRVRKAKLCVLRVFTLGRARGVRKVTCLDSYVAARMVWLSQNSLPFSARGKPFVRMKPQESSGVTAPLWLSP